jgi:hypothetical protein
MSESEVSEGKEPTAKNCFFRAMGHPFFLFLSRKFSKTQEPFPFSLLLFFFLFFPFSFFSWSSNMPNIQCPHCPGSYTPLSFEKHERKHKATSTDFTFQCKCGLKFERASHLYTHASACSGKTPAITVINPLKRPLDVPTVPLHTVATPEPEHFTFGGQEVDIGDLTLDRDLLNSLYREAGLPVEPDDPDLEEDCLPSPTTNLFPHLETFLAYLLFQQEGSYRVSERNMNLMLQLIRDPRLDRSKFPQSTGGIFFSSFSLFLSFFFFSSSPSFSFSLFLTVLFFLHL